MQNLMRIFIMMRNRKTILLLELILNKPVHMLIGGAKIFQQKMNGNMLQEVGIFAFSRGAMIGIMRQS